METETQIAHLETTLTALRAELACRKMTEEELRQQLEAVEAQKATLASRLIHKSIDLIELNEIRGRFYDTLAHEIRTPLTLILGPLQDALNGQYGALMPVLRAHMGLMQRNGIRLLRLVNQLLDLSRLEAGHTTLRAQPLDPQAFLEDLFHCFSSVAERRQIRYQYRYEAGAVAFYGDPEQLERVFFNLLSNAFKYTPDGGAVQVRVTAEPEPEPGMLVILVKDSGIGIAPDLLPVIFDRFRRLSDAFGRVGDGTGIGLALARELVLLHGGRIAVESEAHFGSTFAVRLPLGRAHLRDDQVASDGAATQEWTEPSPRSAAMAALMSPPPLFVPARGEDATPGDEDDVPIVMVVDDDAELRAYVRTRLAPRYRIIEAAHGGEALAQARLTPPDLILCDVVMPEMDGYTLCRTLKNDPDLAYIPVILITARSTPRDALEGLSEGAVEYLGKPFDMRELELRVDNLLRSRQRLQSHFSAPIDPLLSAPARTLHASEVSVRSVDDTFLDQVRGVIEANMADETFSVAILAAELGLSRVHLYRRLKSLLGQSPAEVIRQLRLERAAQLLAAQAGQVSEIAYGVGFKSVAHFSQSFRDHFGQTPTLYQAHQLGGDG